MWATGRVSGIVGLALLTISVLLGLVTRSGRPLPGLPRFSVSLVHRNVAVLSTAFIVLHVVTLLFDSYAKLNLINVFLPFFGSFKPFWQGLGTVAFDFLIAILITGLLRQRIGAKAFRLVHWLVYAMWPLGLAHSIGNGTDGTDLWFLGFGLVSVLAVLAALGWRLSTGFGESGAARKRAESSILSATELNVTELTTRKTEVA
nr:ferric reductase-like transmembrane domain-containing protein [Psychromicrobium silvestre]